MSVDACAALIARAVPDRWAAVLAAPKTARAPLIVLYAFNLEVARAPWASAQSLIAQMRLQWWRDVVAEAAPRAHEVAAPMHDLIQGKGLDVDVIDRMIAARLWDIGSDPFENMTDFEDYIDATAGGLMQLAAQALGAGAAGQACARNFGQAAGLARFLAASAELSARGRMPLLDASDAAICALAQTGLKKLQAARTQRRVLGAAWPALLAEAGAGSLLKAAVECPDLVRRGALAPSPAAARARLIWASFRRAI